MTTLDDIRERLREVRPAGAAADIVALGMLRDLDVREQAVTIVIAPAPAAGPALAPAIVDAVVADMRRAVGALEGIRRVEVRVVAPAAPQRAPQGEAAPPGPGRGGAFAELGPIAGVGDILAVASTKGGVGKSTVAVNLALALSHLGQRVGLLDADVYGPSLPIMLGATGRPRAAEGKRIEPLEAYGLRLMSIGFFLDDSSPVIWRGPLVMGLVRQFLRDVDWGTLDVLVVDLPPGTGDAQLTLVQQVPLSGVVVVTTPQDVATLDVQRGIAMFRQVNAPVVGVIENMSYYECPGCATRDAVFGTGGGERIAVAFGVPLLGQIPLVLELRSGGDTGKPLVAAQPRHPVSQCFTAIAAAVRDAMARERAAAAPPTIIA